MFPFFCFFQATTTTTTNFIIMFISVNNLNLFIFFFFIFVLLVILVFFLLEISMILKILSRPSSSSESPTKMKLPLFSQTFSFHQLTFFFGVNQLTFFTEYNIFEQLICFSPKGLLMFLMLFFLMFTERKKYTSLISKVTHSLD